MLAAPNSTASPEGHTNQNASGGLRVHSHPSDKLHHTPVPVRDPTVTDSRNNESMQPDPFGIVGFRSRWGVDSC